MVQKKKKNRVSVTRRKDTAKRQTPHRKKKGGGLGSWLRRHMPGWAWWLGFVLVVLLAVLFVRRYLYQPDTTVVSYPEGFTVYGIDISRYQETIDWELLHNRGLINGQPVRFVFMKATQGIDRTDPTFARNFQQARQYGFRRSAYHYFEPRVSASRQASFFISHVELEEGDLPPVLDVEEAPVGMSLQEFKWSVVEWLSLVEQHYGVKPILYASHSFRLSYLDDVIFRHYPFWIAHYDVDRVKYKGPWHFWQFSDKGQLPGVKGHVDLDVFNGTLDDLIELTVQPPASPDPESGPDTASP